MTNMTNKIMKYYLHDNQNAEYFGEYNTLDEIREQLTSYHDLDYSGVKENDEPYNSINEFLDTLQSDTHRLNWLLEYGDWSIDDEEGNEVATY